MSPDELREHIGDREVVASVSGGKDSAAMCCFMREAGIPFTPVFLDTGWESRKTYEYLRGPLTDFLGSIHETRIDVELDDEVELMIPAARKLLGRGAATKEALALHFEERMGHYSAMIRLCILKGMFPSRQRRFCTQQLKVYAMKAYLENCEDEPINAVGIRNDESARRANMGTWEWSDAYDCEIWRPIRTWTEADVIAAHHRHQLLPNPHYLKGSSRVGCWPCIHARKQELQALGRHGRDRVTLMSDLELVVGDLAEHRAAVKGGTLEDNGHHRPAWFQSRDDDRKHTDCIDCSGSGKQAGEGVVVGLFGSMVALADCDTCKGKGKTRTKGTRGTMWPIEQAVAYGLGDQEAAELFAAGPRDQGCMRWGLCEHEAVNQ